MNAPGATLRAPASVAGVGVFTARPATATIRPAAPGAGLAFRRVDLPGQPLIPARVESLSALPAAAGLPEGLRARNTNLANPQHPAAIAMTVEHILSALAGLGITDATIDLDGPEVPIGDGSALPFVQPILDAGAAPHNQGPAPLIVREPVTVSDGPARLIASPRAEPGTEFIYELDYGPGAPLPPQTARIVIAPPHDSGYADQVAPARTFCLLAEAEAMRAMGLFAHLSPRDMLVFGPDGPIDNALRLPDEPARHKLLDLIGDLALVGRPIQARIVASRSGHALNHALAEALVRQGASTSS